MGLDVGTVRIGMALSDETGTIASPHGSMDAKMAFDKLVQKIRVVCETNDVGTLVLGMPLTMNGEARGKSARLARKVGAALGAALGLEVVYMDERFTTSQAERALIGANVRRQKRKRVIDKVAAALILQSYLDSRSQNEP